jgi:hypothetical protein
MAPPSEFDLRAALREGEGDGPDADLLIAAGQTRRAQRRVRLLSTAVVIAVVGGGAFGATQLGGSHESGGSSADVAAGAAGGGQSAQAPGDAVRRSAQSGAAYQPVSGAEPPRAQLKALADIPCPAAAPNYLLPGGGGLTT